MRPFLAALSLLSCVPLGSFQPTEQEMRRSIHFFPVVGIVFGALFFALAHFFSTHLPLSAGAMLLTLLPEFLTKGFHLDGLADTADGFLSSRSRERKLEIMRDSRTGTMGVFAIFALLGMKYALFDSMDAMLTPAAALMMLNGRCSMVLYIGMSSYARKEGLGALFFQSKPWFGMIFAYCAMLVCGWFLAGMRGIVCGAMIAVFSWVWSRMTFRVIGGATGDTIGANEELSELLTLFLLFLEVADF